MSTSPSASSASDSRLFASSLSASFLAALLNFPLWRASAIAQSGFELPASGKNLGKAGRLYSHALAPPFPGAVAVVGGMTWARFSIFYGSDRLKAGLAAGGVTNDVVLRCAPALLCSAIVQVCNMPIIRATITLQNPSAPRLSVYASLRGVVEREGLGGLWHGTSAGLLKTVPKYVTSVAVKDLIGEKQERDNMRRGGDVSKNERLWQSFVKSVAAGVTGAALTNPADVLRNEMFKEGRSGLLGTLRRLNADGPRWMFRGMSKNLLAVAAPVSVTIFFTDLFSQSRLLSAISSSSSSS